MRFSVILLITIFSFPSLVWAQNGEHLVFYIYDEDSNEPISGAKVETLDSALVDDSTDLNGYLSVPFYNAVYFIYAPDYDYEFEFVHKEQHRESDTIKVALTKAFEELEQAVVTATRAVSSKKYTTVSIESITPDLLADRNSLRISDGLKQLNGVAITDNQINIRNGSGWSYGAGSRVLIMMDDMPLLSGDAGQPLWTFMETDGIGSLTVLKGASSALYGSSALSGVVNITTEKAGVKPKTKLRAFYGTYNRPAEPGWEWSPDPLIYSGGSISHSRRIKGLSYRVAGWYVQDDGYRMGDVDNRFTYKADVKKFILNDRAVIGVRDSRMVGNSSSFLLWQNYDSAYTALNNDITKTEVKRAMTDVYFKYFGKKRFNVLLQGRNIKIDNDVDNGDPTNDQSNSSDFQYGELRVKKSFRKWVAQAGYTVQGTQSNSPLFQGRHTTFNHAPYAQLEWRPISKLKIELGGRYETFRLDEKEESKPVFRTGLNYQLAKYTFLRGSFGQGFRFPTIAESFITTSVGPVQVFANDQLESETSWTGEIGILQAIELKGWKFTVDLAGFWTEYQNMMEFTFAQWSDDVSVSNGLGFGFKSINIGNTRVAGGEGTLSGIKEFRQLRLEFRLGYTYSNPTSLETSKIVAYDGQGRPITYDSTSSDPGAGVLKYRYRHLGRGQVRVEWKRFDLGVNLRVSSYMENIDRAFVAFPIDIFVPGIAEARQADENGDYFIDLQAGFDVNSFTRFGISANNILMRQRMDRPADMNSPGRIAFQISVVL